MKAQTSETFPSPAFGLQRPPLAPVVSASQARSNPPILAGRFNRGCQAVRVLPKAPPVRSPRPRSEHAHPPVAPPIWLGLLASLAASAAPLVRCPLRLLSALTRPLCATQAAHGRSSIHPPRVRRHRRGHRFRSVSPATALRGGRLAAGSPAQAAQAIGHQGGHAGAPLASAERPASP